MIDFDFAWAAGFIDGEGCISIHKLRRNDMNYYSLSIKVTNTNKESIDKLKSIFKCGSITHYKPKDKKECWVYDVSSKGAFKILNLIRQYSIVKREQINVAIEFYLSTEGNGGQTPKSNDYHAQREQYYLKLQELK